MSVETKGKNRLAERLRKIHPCSECQQLRGMVLIEENGRSSVGYCHCLRGRLLKKLVEQRDRRVNAELCDQM